MHYRVIRYIKLVAIFIGALFAGTVNASDNELTFNRDKYGQPQTPFPIWSPLTPFEIRVLDSIPQAQAGDADALLAFYILAAGSHRNQSSYLQIQQQVDQWLATLAPAMQRQRNPVERAKLIHDAMHRDFFLNDDDGNTLIGYHADQSRLPEIFNSREFNCISSSMLYLVLARKQELPVEAVLLPSHTFVQIDTGKAAIEIETTSIYGFDIEHDEEFYQHEDLSWFEARNLEPTTYQDYLQREILSAYQLGLHNMWSQHTRPERMAYQDRMRLAEIRGFLESDDADAQKNRLNFYLKELGYLNRIRDHADAYRLSALIADYVEDLSTMAERDEVLRALQINVQMEIALAKIYGGEINRGFALAKQLHARLESQPLATENSYQNLLVVISHYLLQGMQQYDYANLRLSLIGLEEDCISSTACSQSLTQFYANWAQDFWNQEDWQSVSRILTEYTQFGIDNHNSDILRGNAALAYVNQAKQLLWDGDWEAALDHLHTCTEQLSGEQKCSAEIRYIKEQRHLGNL